MFVLKSLGKWGIFNLVMLIFSDIIVDWAHTYVMLRFIGHIWIVWDVDYKDSLYADTSGDSSILM
jgi:hypothetical protein